MLGFDDFILDVNRQLEINTTESRKSLLVSLQKKLLKPAIELIINDDSLLKEISKRSYFHKNGFLKVLLIDMRPKYSVRLHIWPINPFLESDIHDHPWDMTGMILNGSYSWNIYKIYEASKTLKYKHKCNYLSDYSGHYFKQEGPVSISMIKKISLEQGDIFDFESNSFHNIEKFNPHPADSIVVTGENQREYAQVITSRDIVSNEIYFNDSIDTDLLKSLLNDFIKRI